MGMHTKYRTGSTIVSDERPISMKSGTEFSSFLDLFEPSPTCIEALYGEGLHKITACGCTLASGSELPPNLLLFQDAPKSLRGVAPYVADVVVSSRGSGCSDVVEAIFVGTDRYGTEIIFGGHVEALGDDAYRIKGKLESPGSYELKVRTI